MRTATKRSTPRAPARPRRAQAPAVKRAKTADPVEVRARLAQAMPSPRCELDHASAWQLLIATILSAQSTDARVNLTTPALFARFATPRALGSAEQVEVEELVRSTGFYRNKAKAIIGASRMLDERHGGEVPRSIEPLLELPGVARKTANVVLGVAYGLATGFVVDTHAARVAQRLGISGSDEPAQIEQELCTAFPKDAWIAMSHRFVLHGRYVCRAQKPSCERCPLAELCPSAQSAPEGSVEERCRGERALIPSRA
jgi:endonuclease-3